MQRLTFTFPVPMWMSNDSAERQAFAEAMWREYVHNSQWQPTEFPDIQVMTVYNEDAGLSLEVSGMAYHSIRLILAALRNEAQPRRVMPLYEPQNEIIMPRPIPILLEDDIIARGLFPEMSDTGPAGRTGMLRNVIGPNPAYDDLCDEVDALWEQKDAARWIPGRND